MRPGPGGYAGVVSRGVAFVIDALIATLICTVGFQLTVAVLATLGITNTALEGTTKTIGYLIALQVVFGTYCAVAWALLGRTIGMLLLGVRVVDRKGANPGLVRSALRALCYWLSAILLIGFAWIAFDRRRQGFHDKVAGTFVVYDRVERQSRTEPPVLQDVA